MTETLTPDQRLVTVSPKSSVLYLLYLLGNFVLIFEQHFCAFWGFAKSNAARERNLPSGLFVFKMAERSRDEQLLTDSIIESSKSIQW